VSIQVAILKILASHGSGRATIDSLSRDIAILSASGAEWRARLRRLASRVPAIDIFGAGYVLRDDAGWEITAAGRAFLCSLEAVTQDNLPAMPAPEHATDMDARPKGDLIVVGYRFQNRIHRRRNPPSRHAIAAPGKADAAPRGGNVSK
jgi:hypothetical protein